MKQIAKGNVQGGAKWDEARITGWVPHANDRGWDPVLDVPLVSHIHGNLWMGGCKNRVQLPREFKHVVSLYPWEGYILAPGTTRVEYQMYDAHDQSTKQVEQIASRVVAHCEKGQTLVHCQAGLNRSGLIAGRALVLMGLKPEGAIRLLRDKRSHLVLCNEAFEKYVLEAKP